MEAEERVSETKVTLHTNSVDDLVGLERRLGELDTERNLGGAIVDGHLRGDLELDVNLLWHRLFSPAGGEKEEGCKQPGQG